MQIEQQIRDLIQKYPTHYTRKIKADEKLSDWVLQNSLVSSSNFAEMVYSAINQKSNQCPNQIFISSLASTRDINFAAK